jgi:ABC-type transport system involved in multi-copper enzyme maturation permease subunit
VINELWNQMIAVIRMEIRKSFFSKRSIWIYLLAFAPAFLLFINSFYAGRESRRLAKIAADHPIPPGAMRAIRPNMTVEEVVASLGEPYQKDTRHVWTGPPPQQRRGRGGPVQTDTRPQQRERLIYRYTDGETDMGVWFMDGKLMTVNRRPTQSLPNMLIVFATQFQLYFVRLAIFFGCAGVFTNLFRGELLDKSLHFYLLAPIPRPVLVFGKYLAALFATSVIFSLSTALQFAALLRGYDSTIVDKYLQNGGWDHVFSYMSVAALACVGYGSVFLAAGLITNNPTVPAAFMLIWESVNAFMPGTLKMASVLFYLQSLCPIAAPVDRGMPPFLRALISAAEPTGIFTSILAIATIAGLVLFLGSLKASQLEINYSAD